MVTTGGMTKAAAGLIEATKTFGGTAALSKVTIHLIPGEVLALLGENGAGKSTCVKLLAGVYQPDQGRVEVDGKAVSFHSPLDAQRTGIAVMHQHPGLFPDLSVAENIFIGHPLKDRFGRLDYGRMAGRARELLETVGLACDPMERLGGLSTSEQQLVEITRALSLNSRVLVMDEPTAALSQREVERLFAVVAELRTHGVAMMFVGHRMDEIYRVADRIAVLRDGRLVGTELASELTHERAVQLMVGRPLDKFYPHHDAKAGEILLSVKGLARDQAFQGVSFDLRAGEILGLGGLVGSGRTEIARVLFGIDHATAGWIGTNGDPVAFRSTQDAMNHGIAYVSEDRIGQSLVMDFSILTNATITVLDQTTRYGLVTRSKELTLARPPLDRLQLRFKTYDQPVRTLSGGNQQKVVLCKWLLTNPRVLILDEPTQGIDIQTKANVHTMMVELAGRGLGILLISSELPELLGMCDRIIVLREGAVAAQFARGEATQEKVIGAATGAAVAESPVKIAPLRPAEPKQAPVKVESQRIHPLRRLLAQRELGLVAAITAVVFPIMLINPRMLSAANLTALSMDAALLIIVAIAQMLVVITRNIDLSVASVIGLAAYAAASTLHAHPEIGVGGATLISCGVGLVCGLTNGLIVTKGHVPAIVATLGTMSVFRGANSLWAGGKQISADQVPQAWLDLTSTRVLGVPAVVLIALAALVVVGLALRFLPAGRELFAIGSNPDGAKLIGIPVASRVLAAFAIAGLMAGFDGGLWASRYATIDARVATGFELTVIAAVVVGGVAIRGGAGTLVGVALGALTLLVIRNGLTLVRVDPLWLEGVYGLIILVAVSIDALVGRRSRKGHHRAKS
jgi:rhamnose transport system ATP-binding protein